MTRRAVPSLALVVAVALGVTGCSNDGESASGPTSSPVLTSTTPTTAPSATPTTPPSPIPTTASLSRFESEPAVRGLRAYYSAAAAAINARDPQFPGLIGRSTPQRQAVQVAAFRPEFGRFVPGPIPFTPVSVTATAANKRLVVICIARGGWSLTREGGTPATARSVVGVDAELVLVGRTWKVDGIFNIDPPFDCSRTRVPFAGAA